MKHRYLLMILLFINITIVKSQNSKTYDTLTVVQLNQHLINTPNQNYSDLALQYLSASQRPLDSLQTLLLNSVVRLLDSNKTRTTI